MGKNHDQLGIEERTMIQTPLEMGVKPAAIAKSITRSAATVSRELRRKACAARKRRAALDDRLWQAAIVPRRPTNVRMAARSSRVLRVACDREPRCGIQSCTT